MKTALDIDQEYSDHLGEEIDSINEFSGDFYIEIDHRLIVAEIDVQIKNGKFTGVDNVSYFTSFTSKGEKINTLLNADIELISEIIELIPTLKRHIIEQAFKVHGGDNDN